MSTFYAYSCPTCPSHYSTEDASNAKRHRRSIRHTRIAQGLGPTVRVWKCTACSANFARSDNFRVHLATAKHQRNVQWCQRRTVRQQERRSKLLLRARAADAARAPARPPRQRPEPQKTDREEDIRTEVTRRVESIKAKRAAVLNRTLLRPSPPFRSSSWRCHEPRTHGAFSRCTPVD